jgi:homeobox protein ESX1
MVMLEALIVPEATLIAPPNALPPLPPAPPLPPLPPLPLLLLLPSPPAPPWPPAPPMAWFPVPRGEAANVELVI